MAIVLVGHPAPAQTNGPSPTDAPDATDTSWSVGFSTYAYFIRDQRDYFQPTLVADHGRLHLEGRYNYEALETGSAWIGCNLSAGKRLKLDVTPIAGGVFGELMGVAAGYEATLTWRKLELYNEGQFVYDTSTTSESFLYGWLELTVSPVEWFKVGVAAQRTRAQDNQNVQGGLEVGLSFDRLAVKVIAFDLVENAPTLVVAAEITR